MNLLSLIGAVGLSGLTPLSVPQQQENENVNITYKYQSNVVNNINDLVEGNIYYLDNIFFDFNQGSFQGDFTIKLLQFDTFSINFGDQSVDDFYPSQLSNGYEYGLYINLYDTGDCYINFNLSEDCYCNLLTEQVLTIDITSCVFQIFPQLQGFKYFLQDAQLSLPQYTDYNVIESVTPIEPSTSDIYNVTEDYIYNLFDSDLDSYTFTIGNQSITLRKWLAITIAIVVIILLVIILALIVRWIVRLFVNCFNRI